MICFVCTSPCVVGRNQMYSIEYIWVIVIFDFCSVKNRQEYDFPPYSFVSASWQSIITGYLWSFYRRHILGSVLCVVLSVSGTEMYAQIMRWCGLEQVFWSNLVPTSDGGQPVPNFCVRNLHSLSPTKRSSTQMKRDEWNEYNIQRAKDSHGGQQFLN